MIRRLILDHSWTKADDTHWEFRRWWKTALFLELLDIFNVKFQVEMLTQQRRHRGQVDYPGGSSKRSKSFALIIQADWFGLFT